MEQKLFTFSELLSSHTVVNGDCVALSLDVCVLLIIRLFVFFHMNIALFVFPILLWFLSSNTPLVFIFKLFVFRQHVFDVLWAMFLLYFCGQLKDTYQI
jgi:hypothetical protein